MKSEVQKAIYFSLAHKKCACMHVYMYVHTWCEYMMCGGMGDMSLAQVSPVQVREQL